MPSLFGGQYHLQVRQGIEVEIYWLPGYLSIIVIVTGSQDFGIPI
jgi:hypothetical protein